MIEKVAFTMIPVKDPARAREFYGTTLGLPLGSHSENGVWTEYDLPGGGCIALFGGGTIAPSSDAGTSVALEVTDLDAMIAKLEGQGVRFKERMIHSPVCRMAVLLDSEGNALMLHELKKK